MTNREEGEREGEREKKTPRETYTEWLVHWLSIIVVPAFEKTSEGLTPGIDAALRRCIANATAKNVWCRQEKREPLRANNVEVRVMKKCSKNAAL